MLFNLFMNGHALQNRVVFLEFEALCSVLAVLCGDVTGCAGHSAGFVFGAFEDDLHAITFCFLCHLLLCF